MKLKSVYFIVLVLWTNILIAQSHELKVKIVLEGPYTSNQMIDNLYKQGILPSEQPFNVSPWNYDGNESWTVLPVNTVIDWLLVDLVAINLQSDNTTYDLQERQAALLRGDGQIINTFGGEILNFQFGIPA